MSHNLVLQDATSEFDLLQTPTWLTHSVLGLPNSQIRDAYIDWARDKVYGADLDSDDYRAILHSRNYLKHVNQLLVWLMDHPQHTWSST